MKEEGEPCCLSLETRRRGRPVGFPGTRARQLKAETRGREWEEALLTDTVCTGCPCVCASDNRSHALPLALRVLSLTRTLKRKQSDATASKTIFNPMKASMNQ